MPIADRTGLSGTAIYEFLLDHMRAEFETEWSYLVVS